MNFVKIRKTGIEKNMCNATGIVLASQESRKCGGAGSSVANSSESSIPRAYKVRSIVLSDIPNIRITTCM